MLNRALLVSIQMPTPRLLGMSLPVKRAFGTGQFGAMWRKEKAEETREIAGSAPAQSMSDKDRPRDFVMVLQGRFGPS